MITQENRWPWCEKVSDPSSPSSCCKTSDWLLRKVACRYAAVNLKLPGDLGCDLTMEEWAAIIRYAVGHYAVGVRPDATTESIVNALETPWYAWENILMVDQNIAHFDYGLGVEIGRWAVPQFHDCYPYVAFEIESDGELTPHLSNLIVSVNTEVTREPLNTYLRCSGRIFLTKGMNNPVTVDKDRYIRWFLVGDPSQIGFFDEVDDEPIEAKDLDPPPKSNPEALKKRRIAFPVQTPTRSTLVHAAGQPLLKSLSVDPKIPCQPVKPKPRPITNKDWAGPIIPEPPVVPKMDDPPPGSYFAEEDDEDTYINGRLVPYVGPWYYDVTDWLTDSNQIEAGVDCYLVPGIYFPERRKVVRVNCLCYYPIGNRNWRRHISIFERASFMIRGLKKIDC